MSCKMLCIIAVIFFGSCLVNARVFYVDGPVGSLNPPRVSYPDHPVTYLKEDSELASRDLDLSFSAGEPTEIPADKEIVYPAKKVYAYETPERTMYEVNRDYEPRTSYYKVSPAATRRIVYGDRYPVPNRKLVRLNNNGPHKGEIVLELRVTANNNNANNNNDI